MTQVIDKLDKEEIKSMLHARMPSVLRHLFPNGTFSKGGSKFHIGNVQGKAGKSLEVDVTGAKVGQWQDFATGEKGDILTLWAFANGMDTKHDFPKVIESVEKWLGVDRKVKLHTFNSNKSSAFVAPESEKSTGSLTKTLTGEWHYLSEDGKPIVNVKRYDTSDGKKEFLPYDVLRDKHGLPEIRPLYNLPGIAASQSVVIVEGEKAAQALIDAGICATTAIGGANAPIDKTDWWPLFGKEVVVWPDNDEPGKKYARAVSEKLKEQFVRSLHILKIPKGKRPKWDAADAIAETSDIKALLKQKDCVLPKFFGMDSVGQLEGDKSPMPTDLIYPRILIEKGLLVIAGAPKVGKSSFLLSLLIHLAAGTEFLGFKPPRPLKIAYLQTEIRRDYLRERIQMMKFPPELMKLAYSNLFITSEDPVRLDQVGVETAKRSILYHFFGQKVDIIALDPLRHVFDRGPNDKSENDNGAMLDFLQQRLEVLRDLVNPSAGMVLIHHIKKMSMQQLDEDGFQALAGASALHAHFSAGILMYRHDKSSSVRKVVFESRYGKEMAPRYFDTTDDKWIEVEYESEALVRKSYGQKQDAEHERKRNVIVDIIRAEALKGNVYTMNQFCEAFGNTRAGLGGPETVRRKLNMLATSGYIRFFENCTKYGLIEPTRTIKYGYLCVENMELITTTIDAETGKAITQSYNVEATHFKCRKNGKILPIECAKSWVYFDEERV